MHGAKTKHCRSPAARQANDLSRFTLNFAGSERVESFGLELELNNHLIFNSHKLTSRTTHNETSRIHHCNTIFISCPFHSRVDSTAGIAAATTCSGSKRRISGSLSLLSSSTILD
ncbi:hypothetical protein VTL71DRAFT_8766, partial [Oculimacula yallundae]